MSRVDVVTLVWSPHEARTASFAEWLDAPLYNIHYLAARKPFFAPFKYPLQWIKTWYEMFKVRPRYIYVTNSPPIAGLCVYVYCLLTSSNYIMDTHTPNLYGKKWGWTAPLQRFLARRATMNIVDQAAVAKVFESWGAKVMVLENPPKNIPQEWLEAPAKDGPIEFTYVGTFGGDEPIDIVIDAARQLPDYRFHILGDTGLAKREWLENVPENVIFPGYLLKQDYWGLLSRSRSLIVLTTHSFSLSGAAQDGIHIKTPVIVSDAPPLRLHFTKGTVFVDNTVEGIITGIQTLLKNQEQLEQEIAQLYTETSDRWKSNFQALQTLIQT